MASSLREVSSLLLRSIVLGKILMCIEIGLLAEGEKWTPGSKRAADSISKHQIFSGVIFGYKIQWLKNLDDQLLRNPKGNFRE